MKKNFLLSATAVVFAGSIAFAEPSFAQTDDPYVAMQIAELDGLGFKRIEVKTGLTQTKIEAINVATNEKREIVMDTALGTILSEEVGTIGLLENTADGVIYRSRNRNFVEVDDNGADTSDTSSDDSLDDDNGADTSGHSSDDDGSDDDRGSDSNDSGGSSDSND